MTVTLVKDATLMQLSTTRFGEIEIDPATIIQFPLGLLGFEKHTGFVLIDSDDAEPMRWLQSVDDGSLAFLVVEPELFFADYRPALSRDDREFLALADGEEPLLACMVVIPDNPQLMTINLMGPLALNAEKRMGKQIVLHDSAYSTKQRLIPDEQPTNPAVPV